MKITCIRCDKEIDSPDQANADYIIADDLKESELEPVLYALVHNQNTLDKQDRGEDILDEDLTSVTVNSIEDAEQIDNVVRLVSKIEKIEIQKTGIICPDCYRPTDFVIWGVHKQ